MADISDMFDAETGTFKNIPAEKEDAVVRSELKNLDLESGATKARADKIKARADKLKEVRAKVASKEAYKKQVRNDKGNDEASLKAKAPESDKLHADKMPLEKIIELKRQEEYGKRPKR